MKVPDRETCLKLLSRYKVPDNIRIHCKRVAQVAFVLAKALNRKGSGLNLALVESSALLHDITKWDSILNGRDHAVTGYRLLRELGYPEVADLVRQHVYLDDPDGHRLTEAHVLSYADKRVMHTEVVSLRERFDDLLVRYGNTPERRQRIKKGLIKAYDLESRIFSIAGTQPLVLNRLNAFKPDLLQEDIPWPIN